MTDDLGYISQVALRVDHKIRKNEKDTLFTIELGILLGYRLEATPCTTIYASYSKGY